MFNIYNLTVEKIIFKKPKDLPPLDNTLSVFENFILSFSKVSCRFSFFKVLTLSKSRLSENKKVKESYELNNITRFIQEVLIL